MNFGGVKERKKIFILEKMKSMNKSRENVSIYDLFIGQSLELIIADDWFREILKM